MPHWLAFAITTVAFASPVTVLLLLTSPFLFQQTDFLLGDIELIGLVSVSVVIGAVLTDLLHNTQSANK